MWCSFSCRITTAPWCLSGCVQCTRGCSSTSAVLDYPHSGMLLLPYGALVRGTPFSGTCNRTSGASLWQSGRQTLVYDGNLDGSPFNHLSTEYMLNNMTWSGAEAFAAANRTRWTIPAPAAANTTIVAGYARSAGPCTVTFVLVGSTFPCAAVPPPSHCSTPCFAAAAPLLGCLVLPPGNFTYLVVPNAGHLVPSDQPWVAQALIRTFVEGGGWGSH